MKQTKLKTTPQSEEAEKATLGCMILDESTIDTVSSILSEISFYNEKNRKVFQTLLSLKKKGTPIDYIPILNELEKMDDLDFVTREYVLDLGNFVPTTANLTSYIEVLREKELYRSLINTCSHIIELSYSQEKEANELIDTAEKRIFDLNRQKENKEIRHIAPIVKETLKHTEKLSHSEKEITGVSTGFNSLNDYTSGWQNSDLIILAARPSMGKTAFVLNLARHAAQIFCDEAKKGNDSNQTTSVALFSLEMSEAQLVLRFIASEARVDGNKLRKGRLSSDEWSRLSVKVGSLTELPLYIDDTSSLTILQLRAKARRLKVEKNIGLLIIDYLQLMDSDNKESRHLQISEISRQLKLLAKELNIPIIALSQLSRALESRPEKNKRPQLSDLRESGSIEQDADLVLFINRPEVYGIEFFDKEKNTPTKNVAEIIIGKQRNGPIGSVYLSFMKQYGTFSDTNITHANYEPPPSKNSSYEDVGF